MKTVPKVNQCLRHTISPVILFKVSYCTTSLMLSLRRSLSHRNQPIDLLCKSINWFLYDRDLGHERVNPVQANVPYLYALKIYQKTRVFLIFSGGILKWIQYKTIQGHYSSNYSQYESSL